MNESEPRPADSVEQEMTPEQMKDLSKRVSLLMTKPENTDKNIPLGSILGEKGLKADGPYKFTLDVATLPKLYPEMVNWPEGIQKATKEHLLNEDVKVYLVTADNIAGEAISDGARSVNNVNDELLKLRGEEIASHKNPAGTLRKKFPGPRMDYFGIKFDGHTSYDRNGFHSPRTPEELLANLKTFGLLDEAKRLAGME